MSTTTFLVATLLFAPAAAPAGKAAPPPAAGPATAPPADPEPPVPPPAEPAPQTPPSPDEPPGEPAPEAAPAAAPVAAAPAAEGDVPPQPPVSNDPHKIDDHARASKIGGFAAFDLRMSEMDAVFGLTLGGLGGVILRNRIMLGGGGYSLVFHDRDYKSLVDEQELRLSYGGAFVGVYAIRTPRMDGGFGLLLGGGRACMESQVDNECADKTDVFVAHLDGTMYIKLAKIARIALSLGYDFFGGANNWRGPDDWDLAGFTGSVRIELGKFRTDDPPGGKGGKRRGGRGSRRGR